MPDEPPTTNMRVVAPFVRASRVHAERVLYSFATVNLAVLFTVAQYGWPETENSESLRFIVLLVAIGLPMSLACAIGASTQSWKSERELPVTNRIFLAMVVALLGAFLPTFTALSGLFWHLYPTAGLIFFVVGILMTALLMGYWHWELSHLQGPTGKFGNDVEPADSAAEPEGHPD